MSFFFPSSLFSPRLKIKIYSFRESHEFQRNFIPEYSRFLYSLMAEFHWSSRAISQWQSKRSDEMEFTPLYLSLQLNLFISKSWNELLLRSFVFRAWNGANLAISRASSTFLSTINAIDVDARGIHRREIDSRERERESEENDSRNLVSVFTVASAPQFSRSSWKEGKVEAKPPRRNSICRDRKQLSTSVLFRSSLSLSLSISSLPLFLPRYFHSDHQVYLSRRAYSTAKVTFKPNLSRLRAFFHSARMRRNNSPLNPARGKFDPRRDEWSRNSARESARWNKQCTSAAPLWP